MIMKLYDVALIVSITSLILNIGVLIFVCVRSFG